MELKQAEEIIKAELLRGQNSLAEKGHTYAHTSVMVASVNGDRCLEYYASAGDESAFGATMDQALSAIGPKMSEIEQLRAKLVKLEAAEALAK